MKMLNFGSGGGLEGLKKPQKNEREKNAKKQKKGNDTLPSVKGSLYHLQVSYERRPDSNPRGWVLVQAPKTDQ